jgi:aspartokinase-like uncharacterized kinase
VSNQLEPELVVVKVGGSLYDYVELRPRLRRYLESIKPAHVAIFPGGGPFANAVRLIDRVHALGEEPSHWIAVRSLSLAAHFLKQLLGNTAEVVSSLPQCQVLWERDKIAVVDPEDFACDDAKSEHPLPKTWELTSDSLALRLAQRWQADRLILLKSTESPVTSRAEGIVDPCFERLRANYFVEVSVVNLRQSE